VCRRTPRAASDVLGRSYDSMYLYPGARGGAVLVDVLPVHLDAFFYQSIHVRGLHIWIWRTWTMDVADI
jgi:hypothetical protein